MVEMQHFLHQQHPLKLVQMGEDPGEPAPDHSEKTCAGCDDELSGKVYACDACGFYLHEHCANLPQEIVHPFHPCHLVLQLVPKSEGFGGKLSYRCEACNFEMDAARGQFNSREVEILHFSHSHPLRLSYEEADAGHHCYGCREPISGKFYACHCCGYYLHENCANLPYKIRHFFHACPLFLRIKLKVVCDACDRPCFNIFVYHCEKCDFDMHVECTKFPPSLSGEERILHFSHHHPLKLSYENADANCRGCKTPISGKTYACKRCGFYLDESCAKLQREIEHLFHPCTLFLKVIRKYVICDACGKSGSNDFVYHCQNCYFYLHVECAKLQSTGLEDEGDWIKHWSHRHPLQVFRAVGKHFGRNVYCNICGRGISSETDYAACKLCGFCVHKSCLDLSRKIQHRCHPCPLLLGPVRQFKCNTCLEGRDLCFSYQCCRCSFHMDVKCALFSQEVAQGDQADYILHFCHHHPLQVFKKPTGDKWDKQLKRKLQCIVCKSFGSGFTYGCKQCNVYLHKSCLDVLPQTIDGEDGSLVLIRSTFEDCRTCRGRWSSGFHFYEVLINTRTPHSWCIRCALEKALSIRVSPYSVVTKVHFHPCFLTLKLFSTFVCNACFTHCQTHAYCCDQCHFYVGLKCAQLSQKKGSSDEKKHFCHRHPLHRSQDMKMSIASCKVCGDLCLESFYFCNECNFIIHESCLDILPQKIEYFNISLVLLTVSSSKCITCKMENDSGLVFHSIEKGFNLCVECVLWPKSKLNDDGTFKSIHHWHPLAPVDKLEKDANCLLCRGKSSTLMYHCSQCGYYFHKACAELPLEMQHPLHQQHLLTLISTRLIPKSRRSCSLCLGEFMIDDHQFIVYCKECNFQLDMKCVTRIPFIQYEGHPHPLIVVENMQHQEVCQVCSNPCPRKNDFYSQIKESNYAFRCVKCKFTLHLECGPLPCKIKHPCHVHALLLEDFYVEENHTDKFSCHVCEDWRDPRLPIYRCVEGCPMICEITCVISEVIPKLLEDYGDVQLRTTYPNVVSKVLSRDEALKAKMDVPWTITTRRTRFFLRDLVNQVPGHPKMSMIKITGDQAAATKNKRYKLFDREDEDENEEMFEFSKEAFVRFSSRLDSTRLSVEIELPNFVKQHELVAGIEVEGEYWLPQTLVPICMEFFSKYNILGKVPNHYMNSKPFRSCFVFILCAVLHNMYTTKMVDLTCKRVYEWRNLLKLVEEAGFDITFISNKIKLIWEIHFLIKAKEIVDRKSREILAEATELSRKEKDLQKQLEEVREKMEKNKKQQEDHFEYMGYGMKDLGKNHANALLIKWKPAISILDLPQQPHSSNCSRVE